MTGLSPIAPEIMESLAVLGFRRGRDTTDIADEINEGMRWRPVTEADVANALARARDKHHEERVAA